MPKQWSNKYGIKKGDELNVEEKEGSIIIATEKIKGNEKIEIDAKKFGKFHKNNLSAAYHLGYDEVNILFEDKQTIEDIYEIIKNCIGYEIVNQGKDFCQIKAISQVSFSEFDNIIRKVFLLLITMGKNAVEIINKKEYERLNEVIILEQTNNRLTDFCKRILNKSGYNLQQSKTTIIYSLIIDLERMADHHRFLCQYLMNNNNNNNNNNNIKLEKETIKIYEQINVLFEEFYEAYYKSEKKSIEEFYKKQDEIQKMIIGQLINKKSQDTIALHFMGNIIYLLYEMIVTYTELNIKQKQAE